MLADSIDLVKLGQPDLERVHALRELRVLPRLGITIHVGRKQLCERVKSLLRETVQGVVLRDRGNGLFG